MRNPKPSDNILPHKPFGIHVSNVRQWLSFNPLGKVISADQKSSPVSYCVGEGPYSVQAPLSERPGTRQRIKNAPWLMNFGSESLTLITLLHIFLCFTFYISALSKGPVRQASTSYMASTNPFMQLFQEWDHCFRMDAQQIWLRKRVLVQLLILGQPKSGSLSLHFVNFPLLFGQDVILKEQDNRIHPTRFHPKLMNLDLFPLHLGRVAQILDQDDPRQTLRQGICKSGQGINMRISASRDLV